MNKLPSSDPIMNSPTNSDDLVYKSGIQTAQILVP